MAETVAELQAWEASLIAARQARAHLGVVRSVTGPDGTATTYRSLDEINAELARVRGRLADLVAPSGAAPRRSFASPRRF